MIGLWFFRICKCGGGFDALMHVQEGGELQTMCAICREAKKTLDKAE